MSARSPDSLVLELGPSPALTAVLAGLHAGAAVIAVVLPLAWPLRFGLLALIGAGCYRTLWLYALRRAPAAVVAFAFGSEDDCALRRRGAADWEPGRLVDCWVHPRLTLLLVRCGGRRPAARVVIPGDGVAPDAFRRLRVRLRLGTTAE